MCENTETKTGRESEEVAPTAPPNAFCNDTLVFGDDYGDNSCTFKCGLSNGHTGPHMEGGIQYAKAYALSWYNKEAEK